MEQPPRFVAQGESGGVCHLWKVLYGLKQPPRSWFRKFTNVFVQFGMKRCQADHYVFSRPSNKGRVILIVYLDDINITGDVSKGIEELKIFLQTVSHQRYGKIAVFFGY